MSKRLKKRVKKLEKRQDLNEEWLLNIACQCEEILAALRSGTIDVEMPDITGPGSQGAN